MAVTSTDPITLLEAARRHLEEAGKRRGSLEGEQDMDVAVAFITLAIEQLERQAARRDTPGETG
jgi:hypothetical protein